jgi:hypothetical protein
MPARLTRKRATRRVLVHGLVYFGRVFADFMNGDGWEFRYYPDKGFRNLAAMIRELTACDLVYQLGGRVTRGKFLWAAHACGKQRIVMHWLGSDTIDEQREVLAGKADHWVLHHLHHWAESDWMVREVKALGVPCELVPFPSALIPETPTPLPEKFSVLVYVPTVERSELYGLDRIVRVARELPEVSFELVGLLDGPIPDAPQNVRIHGRIPNLLDFYRRSSVVWRPVRHDGVSWMVLESLGHGRHVLWTYPFPGCIQVQSASDAREQIARLHQLHQQGLLQINEEGTRFIACGGYHPQFLRRKIHSLLEEILESETTRPVNFS